MRPSVENIHEQDERKGNTGVESVQDEGFLGPFIVLLVSVLLLGGLAYIGGFLISDPVDWRVRPVTGTSPPVSPGLSPDASPAASPSAEPSASPTDSSCPLTPPKPEEPEPPLEGL